MVRIGLDRICDHCQSRVEPSRWGRGRVVNDKEAIERRHAKITSRTHYLCIRNAILKFHVNKFLLQRQNTVRLPCPASPVSVGRPDFNCKQPTTHKYTTWTDGYVQVEYAIYPASSVQFLNHNPRAGRTSSSSALRHVRTARLRRLSSTPVVAHPLGARDFRAQAKVTARDNFYYCIRNYPL